MGCASSVPNVSVKEEKPNIKPNIKSKVAKQLEANLNDPLVIMQNGWDAFIKLLNEIINCQYPKSFPISQLEKLMKIRDKFSEIKLDSIKNEFPLQTQNPYFKAKVDFYHHPKKEIAQGKKNQEENPETNQKEETDVISSISFQDACEMGIQDNPFIFAINMVLLTTNSLMDAKEVKNNLSLIISIDQLIKINNFSDRILSNIDITTFWFFFVDVPDIVKYLEFFVPYLENKGVNIHSCYQDKLMELLDHALSIESEEYIAVMMEQITQISLINAIIIKYLNNKIKLMDSFNLKKYSVANIPIKYILNYYQSQKLALRNAQDFLIAHFKNLFLDRKFKRAIETATLICQKTCKVLVTGKLLDVFNTYVDQQLRATMSKSSKTEIVRKIIKVCDAFQINHSSNRFIIKFIQELAENIYDRANPQLLNEIADCFSTLFTQINVDYVNNNLEKRFTGKQSDYWPTFVILNKIKPHWINEINTSFFLNNMIILLKYFNGNDKVFQLKYYCYFGKFLEALAICLAKNPFISPENTHQSYNVVDKLYQFLSYGNNYRKCGLKYRKDFKPLENRAFNVYWLDKETNFYLTLTRYSYTSYLLTNIPHDKKSLSTLINFFFPNYKLGNYQLPRDNNIIITRGGKNAMAKISKVTYRTYYQLAVEKHKLETFSHIERTKTYSSIETCQEDYEIPQIYLNKIAHCELEITFIGDSSFTKGEKVSAEFNCTTQKWKSSHISFS